MSQYFVSFLAGSVQQMRRDVKPEEANDCSAMSRKGTLVAYSAPANIKQLRDQAALASMAIADIEDHPESQPNGVTRISMDGQGVRSFAIPGSSHSMLLERVRIDLYFVFICAAKGRYDTGHDGAISNVDTSSADYSVQHQGQNLLDANNSEDFVRLLLKAHTDKATAIADHARGQLSGMDAVAND